MAISSYKIFLMKKTAGETPTYSKVVDIKDFPALGGAPELLETTTLSNGNRTNIKGIQSLDSFEFTANYDKTDFQTLKALEADGNTTYAVWLGGTESGGTVTPDGSDGKFEFEGELSVYVDGAGVNEVVNMKITIAVSSDIEFSAS